MEDAIVAQVEWYMGRVNLTSDIYLKERMDPDLWVDLSVILDFPKMIRLGVRDKVSLATLLHARSSIVEVDLATHRIRPAWARRSTLVLHQVPPQTRLDDLLALLQSDPENPHGLLSVQPAADRVWLAIFDSPTGAQKALPLVKGKVLHSSKIVAEVHVDNFLLDPNATPPVPLPYARSQSPALPPGQIPSAAPVYVPARPMPAPGRESPQPQPATSNTTSPAMGYPPVMAPPIAMPVPVMHHPSEGMHAQYAYAPTPGYIASGYAPPNVGVPRQFVGPRGLSAAPASYIMGYAQGTHTFDPAALAVGAQAGAVQPVPAPAGDGVSAELSKAGKSTEGVTNSVEGVQQGAVASDASGDAATGKDGSKTDDGSDGTIPSAVAGDPTQDKNGQFQTNPVTDPVAVPIPGAQPGVDPSQLMVVGKGPMDPQYMHRAVTGDPSILGLAPGMAGPGYVPYARGGGRGQHQGGSQRGGDRHNQRNYGDGGRGTPRGAGGNTSDPSSRPPANRKGKKANRNNNNRHGHGERHNDGRGDGKADATGSPATRDDRRLRDEKPKPEPNLNSMHFPPLPMANDASPPRGSQLPASKSKDGTAEQGEELGGTGSNIVSGITDERNDVRSRPDNKLDTQDAASLETNTSAVSDAKDSGVDSPPTEAGEKALSNVSGDTSAAASATMKVGAAEEQNKGSQSVKVADINISNSGQPNGSGLSYAAILRSKKPSLPSSAIQIHRMKSDSSAKSGNTISSGDGSDAAAGHNGKDRGVRRRKSAVLRNSQNGDSGKEQDKSPTQSGNTNLEKSGSKRLNAPYTQPETRDLDTVKAKAQSEAARSNSVWANKPKSLFQAAATPPTVRSSSSTSGVEGRKLTSSNLSHDEDVVRERVEAHDRMTDANGQAESASVETQGTAVTEASLNGDDLPDTNQLSMRKTAAGVGAETESLTKPNKVDQAVVNGNQTTAKGAWAMGGPKSWPKNTGNGVLERSSSTADS